jgi:SpoVK/Ycf46/Vps4 family AAA+-type ATPase
MAHPIARLFSGLSGRNAVETVVPRRTFDDVILPPATRRALDQALVQVTSHDVVFRRWGLGERHPTGLALAFHFAGPPGTGKTICADAIAHALGRTLLVVRYAELESMWLGETPKQVAAVFRRARDTNSVLFFDEADAIASRRSSAPDVGGVVREANTVVNVLLQELEAFTGVVIFATNMAANLDPAFERRIRTHVLFEMPGVGERERIWRVQMHPTRTPLARDVDFRQLAERHEASGGDIRNAVLKAALAAVSEATPAGPAVIRQRHLDEAMRDVLSSKDVMRQTIARREQPDGTERFRFASAGDRTLLRMLVVAALLNAAAILIGSVALLVAVW